MSTGWLNADIIAHLENAGYIAVPKECIESIYTRDLVSGLEMARLVHYGHESDFRLAQRKRMATHMAMMLLEKGFIDVELAAPDEYDCVAHTAKLVVIKPRTLKSS